MEFGTDEINDQVLAGSTVQPVESGPWSFWQTVGLSAAIGVASLIVQILFGIVWGVVTALRHGNVAVEHLAKNGVFLLLCVLTTYPLILGMMVLFIRMRRCGSVADYLALKRPSFRSMLPWMGWLCCFMVVSMVVSTWLGRQEPKSMIQLGHSSNEELLCLVLVILAPLVEELFFRGFMFKGLAASRIGVVGAVVLTSLLWTSMHAFQYGWYGCTSLAVLGIILGAARVKTGSVFVPMFIHSVNNLVAVSGLLVLKHTGHL